MQGTIEAIVPCEPNCPVGAKHAHIGAKVKCGGCSAVVAYPGEYIFEQTGPWESARADGSTWILSCRDNTTIVIAMTRPVAQTTRTRTSSQRTLQQQVARQLSTRKTRRKA